jgi:glycosyltransferase 2 family protein
LSEPAAPTRRRFRLLTLLIWIGALVLVAWVLRTVPLGEALAVIGRLRLWQIAVLLIGNGLLIVLFAVRWWVLLRGMGWRIPAGPLTIYRLAAFSISYFTPGSHFGGEPLQVYLLHKRHRVPTATAAASVALEKLIELVVNFSFLAVGIAATLQSPIFAGNASADTGARVLGVSLALLALPLGFLAAVWMGHHPVSWLLSILPQRIGQSPRMVKLRNSITATEADAARLCREHPAAIIEALIASLLSWAALIGEMWLAVYFLGTTLTLMQIVAIMTAARLAILMPSPAAIGTLEAGQVWVFGVLGLDPALGLSLSLIVRARDVLFSVVGLWWGSVMTNAARREGVKPSNSSD